MDISRVRPHGVALMRRVFIQAACCSWFSFAAATPGHASAASSDRSDPLLEMLDGCAVVSPGALIEMRGGVRVAGIDVEFSARLRTLVDGVKVLESVLKLGDQGLRLEARPVADVQGEMAATPSEVMVLPLPAEATPVTKTAIVTVSPLAEEAVIQGAGGSTRILNQVSDRGIVSSLATDASGQSIRREISIDLTIKNFVDLQRNLRAAGTAQRIGRVGL